MGRDFSLRDRLRLERSDHQVIETVVYAAGHFQLNFTNRLTYGGQHGALVGVAMALYHHPLEAKETGTVMP